MRGAYCVQHRSYTCGGHNVVVYSNILRGFFFLLSMHRACTHAFQQSRIMFFFLVCMMRAGLFLFLCAACVRAFSLLFRSLAERVKVNRVRVFFTSFFFGRVAAASYKMRFVCARVCFCSVFWE